jgi:hypothetical protein
MKLNDVIYKWSVYDTLSCFDNNVVIDIMADVIDDLQKENKELKAKLTDRDKYINSLEPQVMGDNTKEIKDQNAKLLITINELRIKLDKQRAEIAELKNPQGCVTLGLYNQVCAERDNLAIKIDDFRVRINERDKMIIELSKVKPVVATVTKVEYDAMCACANKAMDELKVKSKVLNNKDDTIRDMANRLVDASMQVEYWKAETERLEKKLTAIMDVIQGKKLK